VTEFTADLHIHTCLSPCAELEMAPTFIAEKAVRAGLDMIAVCDHNAAGNVLSVRSAGKERGLAVIGGMEITSREEVHVLGYFDNDADLYAVESIVQDNLPGENDQSVFGEQILLNENNEAVDMCNKLLIGATDLPLAAIIELIHQHSGLAVAAHIDRTSFSILSQLGFMPPGIQLDAVELRDTDQAVAGAEAFPAIRSSDAHRLAEIGTRVTRVQIETRSVHELGLALKGLDGRTLATQG
jgi:predicted metal-dependent phosphoesterase TrpH